MKQKKIYQELGGNIKRLRKEANYTQARLSNDAGISRASLANIEAGRQQVLVHHLYAIADALQLDSLEQLLPTVPSYEPPEASEIFLLVPKEGLTASQRKQVQRLAQKGSKEIEFLTIKTENG